MPVNKSAREIYKIIKGKNPKTRLYFAENKFLTRPPLFCPIKPLINS
jgi:hypothetical protein